MPPKSLLVRSDYKRKVNYDWPYWELIAMKIKITFLMKNTLQNKQNNSNRNKSKSSKLKA